MILDLNDETCCRSGCGLMRGCSDRKYDPDRIDCQECARDADDAIKEADDYLRRISNEV